MPTPALACVIALLLLMPTFTALSQNEAAGAPAQAQSASPQVPAPSGANPLSSYRSAGAADPSMPLLVSIDIPLRNLSLLSSIVKQSSDPSSAGFRHFLTYDEVSQTFLPTQAQYHSVLDYLTSSGFTVVSSALNSMIVVRGTAAQVTEHLGQSVELFTNGTYSYYETTGSSTLSGAYSFASNSTGLLMRPDYTTATAAGSGPIPSGNITFTEGGQSAKLLQTVYNATGLLSKGIDGTGYTVGLFDFYGSSLVKQDLAAFDTTYGFAAPPSFTISPVGPYNPNLGTPLGWDVEVDLDVQASHAMAPGANIILYAVNGELPLSTAIAEMVQDGKANVVSQSFSEPEWAYYEGGPSFYLFNSVFADDYYMLGSALGMTFLAATGDTGGSGSSAGPEGGAGYPSTSPFVTAVGGTTTYISKTSSGALSFNQTAWSNIGFVPYFVNFGGSGGGVSILEPTPWYQSSLPVPTSFPDGRMVPDLSLDSTPGTFIIYHGSPLTTGGTSESSPLLAGLLTLLMGAEKGGLGLINPSIYRLAENAQTYQTAFTPVTSGYTTPWVAKLGYNLASGWGAPNIGEIARLYSSISTPASTLNVNVEVGNSGTANFTDYAPGQVINIVASVTTPSGAAVTTGAFTASLQTLGGSTPPVPLAYSPAEKGWTGTITVGSEAGIANVNVVRSALTGLGGEGFATTFVGYLANFIQPLSPYPWTYLPGLETAVSITDLSGKNPPSLPSAQVAFQNYSILSNTYTKGASAILIYSSLDGLYQALLNESLPSGPTVLVAQGSVVGYLPFVSGISLLGSYIFPQVVGGPGTVAPGQSLAIVATVTAPENIYLTQSLATGTILGTTIAEGANVTATLVNPAGHEVETVSLPEQGCAQALRECGSGATLTNGYMTVPANASPGLYTVLLNARYNDETTGYNYTGSYFGQVYVASGASVPRISVGPSTLFEGENATITANITSASGKELTRGVYSAVVYPETSQNDYSTVMHTAYEASDMVSLQFDAKIGMWAANATMPSPNSSTLVSSTNPNSEYYGGPYDIYVSGISNGLIPTTSVQSAQQSFYVQPYVYTANSVMKDPQQVSRLALSNVTIDAGSSPLTLSDDYFVGHDTVTGSAVTIASSIVNGTLTLKNGETTLDGVTGGDVVATNAKVVLQHTALSSLELGTGATASVDSASSYQAITPTLPVLTISSPEANSSYTGTVDAQVMIVGSGVTSLSFVLDGEQLPSLTGGASPGQQVSYPINTTSMPDGTHTLTVVAVQSDLLSTTASVSFVTHNQLTTVANNLATADKTIGSLNGSLAKANSTISSLTYAAFLAIAFAVVGVALAAYSLRQAKAHWRY